MSEPIRYLDAYTPAPQCRVGEENATLKAFQRVAEQRISTFLRNKNLPAEAIYSITFKLGIDDNGDLRLEIQGPLSEDQLNQLGNALLNMARQRGICQFNYIPPQNPESVVDTVCDGLGGELIGTTNGHGVFLCNSEE